MRLSTMRLMQCPWCGRTLWQATDAPDTPKFHTTAECRHCGYRYEARFNPTSQRVTAEATPGNSDGLPDVDIDTLGPPEELTPEHFEWIREQIYESLKDDDNDTLNLA